METEHQPIVVKKELLICPECGAKMSIYCTRTEYNIRTRYWRCETCWQCYGKTTAEGIALGRIATTSSTTSGIS